MQRRSEEREGGGGVDRGTNYEEGGRREVGNFHESGISKYMEDIQNRVLEISNAKKTPPRVGDIKCKEDPKN